MNEGDVIALAIVLLAMAAFGGWVIKAIKEVN